MTEPSDIIVTPPEAGVLLVTLDRPAARNALRTRTLAELAGTLGRAVDDDDIRCVVLTGNGQVFAAGADVKEMAALDAVGLWKDTRPAHWRAIRDFPKPLIAAVNGHCLGGGFELAMHADLIVAGRDASFGQPEIRLGIMPGAGGTQRLARTVGKSLAMRMILGGEPIDAQRALDAGLLAELTEPELALETALDIARTIAKKSPIAVRLAKEAVLRAYETPLAQGLELERKAYLFLAATEDRNEGISAFLERREPRFRGE